MSEKRAFAILQTGLFGLSSIVVFVLTWLHRMSGIDRTLSMSIGAAGALMSVIKARRSISEEESQTNVEAKNRN
jgi:hypothetical protein